MRRALLQNGLFLWLMLLAVAVPAVARADETGAILDAVLLGNPASVREQLEQGATPCARTFDGICAIQSAVQNGHAECARLLWEAGCHHLPELSYELSQNPNLTEADLSDRIARHRADLNVDSPVSPLCVAARYGKLPWVRRLVESGAGETTGLEPALAAAAGEGHWEVVDYLLINQARPTAHALREAAWNAHPYGSQREKGDFLRTLGLLLEKTDPAALTETERHAILLAAIATRNPGGSPEAFRKLTGAGFPLSARNGEGKTVAEVIAVRCTDESHEALSNEMKAALAEPT